MTPNLISLPEDDDAYAANAYPHLSKHSHYSQLDDTADFLPPTPTPGRLHQLLELNEPSRAITWAKAAYRRKENHAVLQVSLCHHYRSTFGIYGSLISPLILLKAIQSAFPSISIQRKPGDVPEYVVKGIRLRSELSESLHMAERDGAATAAFPRLGHIQFDAELVSPDILGGMETPIGKVMEDSQAMSSLNARGSVELGEDHQCLELPMIEQEASILYRPIDPIQPLQKLLGPPWDGTLASQVPETCNATESKSTTTCTGAGEGNPDRRKAASPAASSLEPRLISRDIWRGAAVSASTVLPSPESTFAIGENAFSSLSQVSMVVPQRIPSSSKPEPIEQMEIQSGKTIKSVAVQATDDLSSPVKGRLCERHPSEEVDEGIEHYSTNEVTKHRKKTVTFQNPPNASDAREDLRNAKPSSEEEVTDKPPKSQPNRKRHPSRQALGPAKRQKAGTESSLTGVNLEVDSHAEATSELDGDTIVVESGDTANNGFTATERASPHHQRPGTAMPPGAEIDPAPISAQRREQSPQATSRPRNAKSDAAGQNSSNAPSIFFSSSTEIASKKNTMAFLRRSGGKSVKKITAATMLCVGSIGPLRKTANLILAVCMGLDIVTDKWLIESQRKGVLLDPQRYLPRDSHREGEWKFKLDEAIARGRMQGSLTRLLTGTDVYLLQDLKAVLANNFRDFRTVATCLGADAVRNGLPNGRGEKEVLILGTADDPQTLQASRRGYEVWSKDLLVMGALRGAIQRTDEFIVARPMKDENDR